MFNELQEALNKYIEIMQVKPKNQFDEYKIECAEFDISKAFVYDLGYERAEKFARGILALCELRHS